MRLSIYLVWIGQVWYNAKRHIFIYSIIKKHCLWDLYLGLVLLGSTLCPVKFSNYHPEEERADCFTLMSH